MHNKMQLQGHQFKKDKSHMLHNIFDKILSMLDKIIFDEEEYKIRATLRNLSKQRVKEIPGSIWLIENLLPLNEETTLALKTCFLRGWVELIPDPVMQASYSPPPPAVPEGERQQRREHSPRGEEPYRPTDSGWAVINRSYLFAGLGVLVGIFSIIIAIFIAIAG